jgi:hypothetical protein
MPVPAHARVAFLTKHLEGNMKHILKKGLVTVTCIALLVCGCLLFSSCSEQPEALIGQLATNTSASAGTGNTIANGTCDDGITWAVYEDGLLRLSGSPTDGNMYNYTRYGETPAWLAYADQITSLEIGDGIKTISAEAFQGLKKLIWIQFGNSVTEIGSSAFKNCTNLRRVILPSSVTKIGDSAFSGCYRMYELVMNEGVTSIGAEAFANCYSLLTVSLPDSISASGVQSTAFTGCGKIVEVITTQSVTKGSTAFGGVAKNALEVHNEASKLEKSADGFFYWGTRLVGYNGDATEITIPDTVTAVGAYAFYANTAVQKIVVPNTVTSIGASAFAGCEKLTNVTLGEKVVSIDTDAFAGCWNLQTLTYNAKACKTSPANLFADCAGLANVTFGSQVTSIPDGMFSGCTGLVSISLPAKLTTIGASVFEDCTSLTTVTLGTAVETIGQSAFKNCISLKEIDLSELSSVEIGESAFSGCRSLVTVDLTNVSLVGASAFNGCTSLTGVVVGSSTSVSDNGTFSGCRKLVDVVVKNATMARTIKPGSTSYGYLAYYTTFSVGTSASRLVDKNGYLFMEDGGQNYLVGYRGDSTRLSLPADYNGSSYVINARAFSGNLYAQSVTVSAGVTAIGDEAFANCMSLKTVNLVQSAVSTIGANAFKNCTVLKTVTFNNSLTTIGESALEGCTSLQSITVPASVTTMGQKVFANSGLTTAVLGSGVRELPAYLFSGCASLTTVTVPSGVTKIGEGCFVGCSALAKLTLPATVLEIGQYAFYGCSALKSVVLPDNLTTIGVEAFKNCYGMYSITVGASVENIGERAFAGCDRLLEVINKSSITMQTGEDGAGLITSRAKTVHNGTSVVATDGDYVCITLDGITYLAGYTGTDTSLSLPTTLNGSTYSILNYAFYQSDLTEVTIPAGLGGIGGYAFAESALTKAVINGTSLTIGSNAFSNTPLSDLTLNEGVKVIGTSAFEGCTRLTSVTLPNSLQTIGLAAFRGCTRLSKIDYNDVTRSRLYTISRYAFDDCYSLTQIVLPANLTSVQSNWSSDCLKLVEVVNLSSVSISNTSQWLKGVEIVTSQSRSKVKTTEDGFVFYESNSGNYLIGYEGAETDVVLPDRYKSGAYTIYSYAFYGRDDLTSIRFSDGCTGVADRAFEGCTGLTAVYMPTTFVSSTVGVGAELFYGCSENLLVVCGYASESEVPDRWNTAWNEQGNGTYEVYYGYTYDQYVALIGI